MTLDELGKEYRTDKSSLSNDYLVQYERLFKKRETVTKIAEIGVQRGGKWRNNHPVPSLKMWQHWFYNSTVFGMDLKKIEVNEPNIQLFVGDQSSRQDLDNFAAMIGHDVDMIIDDGSHRPEDMVLTFERLGGFVRKGGYYVFEDCRAKVQSEYPESERIHARLKEIDLSDWTPTWGYSAVSGKESILFLRRK